MLFLIDEASGVEDIIFQVGAGSMSTASAKTIMVGNPTKNSGYFHGAFHQNSDFWWTKRVSSFDSPLVSENYPKEIAATYGIDSNIYRVRVLGEFPQSEDDVVIPLHLIEAARERDVEPSQAFYPVWGLDVARFGDDRSALCKRRSNALLEPIRHWHGADIMETAGRVAKEYAETSANDLPSRILVDVIGLGAGVVDRLRELGLPVRGVNVAEASSSGGYMRLRDQLWWQAREWFEQQSCTLCDDPELIAELCGVKFFVASNGKIQVESKGDMKKRGQRSPDLADAFVLTFAGPLEVKHVQDYMDRYSDARARWMQRRNASVWSR